MNREQVIEWAREAGFQTGSINLKDGSFGYHFVSQIGNGCLVELEKFAALVAADAAAKEREEGLALCATVAGECAAEGNGQGEYIALFLRDAIRARGQKEGV